MVMLLEDVKRKAKKLMAASWSDRVVLLRLACFYYLRKCLIIVLWPVGMLVMFLTSALRPIIYIRVGVLHYDRIGHLALNTELYLRRQTVQKDHKRDFVFFVSGPPSNCQLLTMIRRRVPVIQNSLALHLCSWLRQKMPWSSVWIDLPFKANEYDEFNDILPQLAFSTEEEVRGKQLLASMGIEPGTPFICFHARDKAYLNVVHNYRSCEEWAYHDYRDCNIRNYLSAAEYLASLGLFAVRIGYVVEQVLPTKKPRIIDYASNHRTDFGDIYLCARCKFFLGSAGGPQALPWVLGVPMAYANSIPLMYKPLGKNNIFIPKKLWHIEEKRFLSFREIIDSGAETWHRTEQYTQAGIEVIENTADEILALAKEMNERLDGTWVTTEEDEELQRRFRDLYPPGHYCYGFPSRIGVEFLRQNRELLD